MRREELMRMYEEAGTLARLGERLGLTEGGVRARLRSAQIPVRDARRRGNRDGERPPGACVSDAAAEWQRRYDEAGSVSELARRTGLGRAATEGRLRAHGVAIRTAGYRSPRTVATPAGSAHFNWQGGTTLHADGYVLQYAPWHPAAGTQKGYVLQHRLVMERALGRYLSPHELVHHKNEIKTDNRLENLELMSRPRHIAHHKEDAHRDARGRFT